MGLIDYLFWIAVGMVVVLLGCTTGRPPVYTGRARLAPLTQKYRPGNRETHRDGFRGLGCERSLPMTTKQCQAA